MLMMPERQAVNLLPLVVSLLATSLAGCLNDGPVESEGASGDPFGAECLLPGGCSPLGDPVVALNLSLDDIPAGKDWIAVEVHSKESVNLTARVEEFLETPEASFPKCGVLWSASNRLLFAGEPFGMRVAASPILDDPVDQHDVTGGPSQFVIDRWRSELEKTSQILIFGYSAASSWRATGSDFTADLGFDKPVATRTIASGHMHCLSDPATAPYESYVDVSGFYSSLRDGRYDFEIDGEGQGMIAITGNQAIDATLRGPQGLVRDYTAEAPGESAYSHDVLEHGSYELVVREATSAYDSAGYVVAYLNLPAALSQELGPWPGFASGD